MVVIHDAVSPLRWLIGKWVCREGAGSFPPAVAPFSYYEVVEFESVGQPLLNYRARSWKDSEMKTPMHSEAGFLRIKPGTAHVAFIVAHNNGLTTLEEGEVDGERIELKNRSISRMSFAKDPAVVKIERVFSLNREKLEQIVRIETTNAPLNDHLKCVYEKVVSDT